MAKARDKIIPVRVNVAENDVLEEIARRTGQAVSAVLRGAMLEKGEKMGIHLNEVKPPTKGRGR